MLPFSFELYQESCAIQFVVDRPRVVDRAACIDPLLLLDLCCSTCCPSFSALNKPRRVSGSRFVVQIMPLQARQLSSFILESVEFSRVQKPQELE